jgi:hypothetical protein
MVRRALKVSSQKLEARGEKKVASIADGILALNLNSNLNP